MQNTSPQYYGLQDFSGGNNLLLDAKRIGDNQTLRTSNLVPYAKGILEKKKGSVLYKTIASADKINALKMVQISGDTYLIAIANFSGTGAVDKIYYSKNGGNFTEMSAFTGADTLTASSDYTIAVDNLNHIYISNGTDNMQVSTDGESRNDVSFTTGSLTPTGEYLLWWKDRLWVAGDSTDPHAVFYSDNLAPTTFNAASVLYCGDKDPNDPIMGIIPLTLTSASEGLIDVLAVLRKNSIWVIGFDTAPTYIDQLSGSIGCWDSKSIIHTPMGVMFIGKDNVYSLGRAGEPNPIGSAIKPVWDGSDTDRGRATTVRTASGIYFDGFVRFAYPEVNSTYNNKEYWIDIRDFSNTGWFGDHTGRNLSCFAVNGTTLYAGDSNSGNVWTLEQSTRQEDIGGANVASIPVELKTRKYTIDGSEYTTKIFKRFGFNILTTSTTGYTVYWDIDDGRLVGSKSFSSAAIGSAEWDVSYWDIDTFYGGANFNEVKGFFSHEYRGRYLNFRIAETSAANLKIQNGLMSFIKTVRTL